MKKICRSLITLILIILLLSPSCFAEVDFNKQIKAEDGSMFEKIIASLIGGISQTIFNLATSDTIGIGFKDYDELIFNNNIEDDSLAPFTAEIWTKVMQWYKIFGIVSECLILIATILLAYKVITAGDSTIKKNEAKDSLMRLLLGGIAIAFAPLFIRFLLFLNNSLVKLLVSGANNSLENLLGETMISSIKTGNAITTAIVISMFIYLFVKLNIKFIIRQFTLIVFTIFTPVSVGLWIINKNTTALSIWAGQIVMNIFMQFIYCFLFLMYLTFLPSAGGWAISLIWAMMILPLADSLQNCLQNLTSRIAGVDNEQMTSRVLGMGTMFGYSIGAIKEQFKAPSTNVEKNTNLANDNYAGGLKGFTSRVKSFVNPNISPSEEKSYGGGFNSILNNTYGEETESREPITNISEEKTNTEKVAIRKIARTGLKATKAYLSLGQKMVEGDFKVSNYKNNKDLERDNFYNIEYSNKYKGNMQNMEEDEPHEKK